MVSNYKKALPWRINLWISLIGGILALWGTSLTPSEQQRVVLWSYSAARVLLFLIIILGLTGIVFLLRKSLQPDFWDRKLVMKITTILSGKGHHLGFLLLAISYLAVFATNQQLGIWNSYRERLYPVFLWMMVLSFQILVTLIILNKNKKTALHPYKGILLGTFVLWVFFILITLVIKLTKIGLKPDAVYWQNAGTPLLFWQVLISSAVGGLLFWTPAVQKKIQSFSISKPLG